MYDFALYFRNRPGFTLIELLFVFSVFGVLSTVGIASYVSYSRTQELNSSAFSVVTMLNFAKSRASSQVKPSQCNNQTLQGYKVSICGLSSSPCDESGVYKLSVVCGGSEYILQTQLLDTRPQVKIAFSTDPTKTSSTSFLFKTLTGGVDGTGQITLTGYGREKNIQVDSLGNIVSPL